MGTNREARRAELLASFTADAAMSDSPSEHHDWNIHGLPVSTSDSDRLRKPADI
jgi:hypothetical protein